MTPAELETFLHLTAAITSHQEALDAAVKAKQQLAQTLYKRYGRNAVYRIGEGEEVQDLMISRTAVGSYFFAPRIRYTKESRYAKAAKKRLDRAARMQSYPTQASVPRPPGTEISQAEIEAAMNRGRQDPAPVGLDSTGLNAEDNSKRRLPIVGDVENPPAPIEPRLLEIQEPSGGLVGDIPETEQG